MNNVKICLLRGIYNRDVQYFIKSQSFSFSFLDPRWASINRGVLICDECCSIHRGLGRHSSQVRHLTHTLWPPSQLQVKTHAACSDVKLLFLACLWGSLKGNEALYFSSSNKNRTQWSTFLPLSALCFVGLLNHTAR